ncbi:MAG: NADH-ubiquinone oxidoreductase-F iron-sulfur binding region domain-containing protein [Dehalococcoidales bacterium]|nr:NADH-ubiquinone oxidoreductase-F iron-sulfur binding region domain-containing protein [Dehalococcoidales bacterium]
MKPAEFDSLRRSLQTAQTKELVTIQVCGGTGCNAQGARLVYEAFSGHLAELGLSDRVALSATGCHGFCERGPIVSIKPAGIFYPQVKPEDVKEIITTTVLGNKVVERLVFTDPGTGEKQPLEEDIPFYARQKRIVLAGNGNIDPRSIHDYIRNGGYRAARKALCSMTPEQVTREITDSGIKGRGGAGFLTGRKWEMAANTHGGTKYMVCNGDEGDPGAFMDRSIMEGNPHLVLEGMIIGAFAIGASTGYIYVRAEYPLAVSNLKLAISHARQMGLLGENILNSGFSLDIKVIEGAGAFVCGEETALMASIEGKIGRPRPRPPFPAQAGLWGKPTNINNVETLANIAYIINEGSASFRAVGTETSKGTKIFSLTGDVNNTGLVEVPMGTTLGKLVYEIGGGIPGGRKFKAVQIGGPSGGCLPAKYLGLPIDYESLASIGSIMGSGGLVVMDESSCMVDIARFFLSFTQSESCGKCTPCRIGTKRMLEILTRITRGEGREGDIELLMSLAESIKDTSLCGLGQNAPNPVLSTIKYFRNEYEAHIREKRCPAAACEEIMYAPCEHACPLNVDAPGYIALISKGHFTEALELERCRNPLAGICGRVCHHPCEEHCRRGDVDQPVAIAALKRAAADYGAAAGSSTEIKYEPLRREKIAIVGSGPAGLNAGFHLVRKGYPVTIFEALPVAGGMLYAGIPEFRLPRKVLQSDIDYITSLGVDIRLNTRITSVDALIKSGFNAVLLATGAHVGEKLDTAHDSLDNVYEGVEFLRKLNLGNSVKTGRNVVVIGGGNVAIDAARAAVRLGSESVTIIYRRPRPDMPANRDEVYEAEREGVRIMDSVTPLTVMTDDKRACGVECLRTRPGSWEESGRRRPEIISGSNFFLKADTVIIAIGQKPDISFLNRDESISITSRGTIGVNSITLETSRQGVFAAGDNVTGPLTVIDAMAGGERAAISIDRYLNGIPFDTARFPDQKTPLDIPWQQEDVEPGRRNPMPYLQQEKRNHNFNETNLGFSRQMAISEARRCLRCDLKDN